MSKRNFRKEYRDEFLFIDKKIFGDDDEHEYVCHCYDGHATCEPIDKDKGEPIVMLTYPMMREVLANDDMCEHILQYRGLYDLTKRDLTPADVAMCYGELFKFRSSEMKVLKRLFR